MAEPPCARFEFPSMLYDMLEDVSEDPTKSEIVSWQPHGLAFRVHKPQEFETEIMPDYFTERYNSFKNLLEQWGFHRLSRGKDRGAYYNANFVRGDRKKIAKATKEFMLDVMPEVMSRSDEPDLYAKAAELGLQGEKPTGSAAETKKSPKKRQRAKPTNSSTDRAKKPKTNNASVEASPARKTRSKGPVDKDWNRSIMDDWNHRSRKEQSAEQSAKRKAAQADLPPKTSSAATDAKDIGAVANDKGGVEENQGEQQNTIGSRLTNMLDTSSCIVQ